MSNTTITPQAAPNRRNTELMMLGFAVLVPMLAYANVGLAGDGSLPVGSLVKYGLGLGVFAGLAHLLVRKFAPYADPLLLPLATFLNGMGLMFINRLDLDIIQGVGLPNNVKGTAAAGSQLMYSAIGVALFAVVVVALRDHRLLQRYTYTFMALALVLLVSPIPFPGDTYGAKIWIRLGPFSIQPGEFTKIVITIFFAGYLMAKRDALALASRKVMGLYFPRGRDMGPIIVVWLLSILILVFERDLGTSLLFFGVFVVMLYVATERTSWLLFGVVMAVAGAVVVGTLEPHVHDRVAAWMDPMDAYTNPAPGKSQQLAQALFGYGTGGLLGTGLNQGHPTEIGFAARSDFILTTVGEELGLAGMMAIFMVYALLIERGLRTALAARDPFGKLLAAGLSIALALQVFIVAGGVTGLIPLTGMTMPFLAQGGSSVITNWALVAILIRISDTARRPAPPAGAFDPSEGVAPRRGSHASGRSATPAAGSTPPPPSSTPADGSASPEALTVAGGVPSAPGGPPSSGGSPTPPRPFVPPPNPGGGTPYGPPGQSGPGGQHP
ncbi:FtsW/RodA/SpoVE family cell cycle protein [Embleya scabrispora]|uniref:FtsW/RodA/SpoVE family cell cycle protein n=1 Tax=Embleya scabrispora TaxID=159449 RepID=UPI000372328B